MFCVYMQCFVVFEALFSDIYFVSYFVECNIWRKICIFKGCLVVNLFL